MARIRHKRVTQPRCYRGRWTSPIGFGMIPRRNTEEKNKRRMGKRRKEGQKHRTNPQGTWAKSRGNRGGTEKKERLPVIDVE